MIKRKIIFILLIAQTLLISAQQITPNLEDYFNLCLEFGAPLEIVELFQSFRTYKGENNGTISYVVREDNSLLRDRPYSEYQIWYTVDRDFGLYQSSLLIRGDTPILRSILTSYLRKFSAAYGEPVYTNLENGSLLIFWYNEETFTVQARLILDIVNSYKYVSITYCSPLPRHVNLLRTLYNGEPEPEIISERTEALTPLLPMPPPQEAAPPLEAAFPQETALPPESILLPELIPEPEEIPEPPESDPLPDSVPDSEIIPEPTETVTENNDDDLTVEISEEPESLTESPDSSEENNYDDLVEEIPEVQEPISESETDDDPEEETQEPESQA